VRGFEFVTFEQYNADHEANHSCILPFTRNVFDPMDFTPMCFSEVPKIKRMTTNGFELALSVIFWSGIQHYAEIPEGMAKVPDYVRTFLRDLPPSWDETLFIDGFPGKFIVLARRSGNSWYIAGINGEITVKQLHLKLPFISKNMTQILITDGIDNRTFENKSTTIAPDGSIDLSLNGNGGFILQLKN
jgi:alpha-glucosidase